MDTSVATERASQRVGRREPAGRMSWGRVPGLAVLVLGALLFLFPFYWWLGRSSASRIPTSRAPSRTLPT